uniref:Mutator-like transposase domain-containing protein n=1 Tax=Anopheles quadriannulatus TaxID=34691 RepID=A0A182XKQ3_ANOQN
MMTRRKSIHESTLQAQLQMQERAAEEQLTLGALANGIANILAPSQASQTSQTGTQQQCSGLGMTSNATATAAAATAASPGPVPPLSTLPKPQPMNGSLFATKSSGLSPTGAGTSYHNQTSNSLAAKHNAMMRNKTARSAKRSAPIDVPQSSGGSTPTSNAIATVTNAPGGNTPHGTGMGTAAAAAAAAATQGIACGPNPVQQTLAQNGMDPDEIPKFKGYRIIEIDHFLQWAAYSQFMHSKHCPGGLLKPYQEYISGCYSTFAMKCSKCAAIITRSSENYIHHNKLMNRLVKGTVQLGKDYDEMQQFMESLEVPFVTREEFQSIRGQVSSSLEDQSALQRAVEELERASSVSSKRKRHGSCKYHYEVLKVYLNKKMKKMEENLQVSVNDSVALAVNAHLKNVSHVQLVPNAMTNSATNCTAISGMNGGISANTSSNNIANHAIGTINVQSVPMATAMTPTATTTINGTSGGASDSGTNSTSMYNSCNITNGARPVATGPVSVQLATVAESTIGGGGVVGGRLPPGSREQQH